MRIVDLIKFYFYDTKKDVVKFIHIFFFTIMISLPFKTTGADFRYVENKGQWEKEVLFRGDVPGGYIYVLKDRLKYVFYPSQRRNHNHDISSESGAAFRMEQQNGNLAHAVEVMFVGANEDITVFREQRFPESINFLKGNSPDRWISDAHAYGQLMIADLYPGIDIRLYSNANGIKYDFIIHPGAQPENIRIKYTGQDFLQIHEGELTFGTMYGAVREKKPVCFTDDLGEQKEVYAEYRLEGETISFMMLHEYDRSRELIIDPELIFSTYSGSFADNWGFTATFDEEGNLYSGGIVDDVGYPVTVGVFQMEHAGDWDVGILKYKPDGKDLIYATYLGGSYTETPQSIIVNGRGELVIYGTTSSPDFPMTANSFNNVFSGGDSIKDDTESTIPRLVGGVTFPNGSDLYVAILSVDGTVLRGATFIGGTGNDGLMERLRPLTKNYGDQFRGEVIVDKEDNIYVASNTSSTDFPIVNGWQPDYGGGFNDGIVMKLSPEADQLLWSSYAGGSDMDALFSVKVDRQGNVFAAGGSMSMDFPITAGTLKTSKLFATDIDGVVIKMSNDGSQLLRSTFLGTILYDQVYCMEIDASGRVYVLGQTQGAYPVSPGVYSNPNSGQFIHKISNNLDSTYFSTVVGSGSRSPDFSPTAFLINECENIFLSGWGGGINHTSRGYIGGTTLNMPLTANAFQSTTDGSDFYLMVLLQDARQLLYGSIFGEYGRGDHVDGGTSRFDKKGIIYQSVCGGCGGSSNFPTWPPDVWSPVNNSSNCNNAAFKFDLASLKARFETDTEDFTQRGIRQGCYPLTLVFLNESIGGENFFWEFGEGTTTDQEDSITITYKNPGVYPVILTATDINTCTRVSKAAGTITVFDYEFGIMAEDSICYGGSIDLNATGGIIYQWTPSEHLDNPAVSNPAASPDTTTTYHVRIVDQNGCIGEDSVLIRVIPKIEAAFDFEKAYDCHKPPLIRFFNLSEGASAYIWDFGDGTTSTDVDTEHRYDPSDTIKNYMVTLVAEQSFCNNSNSMPVSTVTPFVPNVITPNDDGKNDAFQIQIDGEAALQIFNRWGLKVYDSAKYKNDWEGGDLAAGVYYFEITFSDKNTGCNGWVQVLR